MSRDVDIGPNIEVDLAQNEMVFFIVNILKLCKPKCSTNWYLKNKQGDLDDAREITITAVWTYFRDYQVEQLF